MCLVYLNIGSVLMQNKRHSLFDTMGKNGARDLLDLRLLLLFR